MNLTLTDKGAAILTHGLIFALVVSVCVVLPHAALAQAINLSPIESVLQSIISALTGTLGKAMATIALIGVAISWFFGVIDLRQAMWVIAGIVAVGSATVIVDTMWVN